LDTPVGGRGKPGISSPKHFTAAAAPESRKKPFYTSLWTRVLRAIAAAVALGYFSPAKAIAMSGGGGGFRGVRKGRAAVELLRFG